MHKTIFFYIALIGILINNTLAPPLATAQQAATGSVVSGVAHTGIVVKDMDRMIRFYETLFGFKKVLDTQVHGEVADRIVGFHVEKERIVILQLGNTQLELLSYQPAGRAYPTDYKSNDRFGMHICLQTENMDRAYERLKTAGVKIISAGPQTIPEDHPHFAGTRVLYFLDPEGHPLELIQFPRKTS